LLAASVTPESKNRRASLLFLNNFFVKESKKWTKR